MFKLCITGLGDIVMIKSITLLTLFAIYFSAFSTTAYAAASLSRDNRGAQQPLVDPWEPQPPPPYITPKKLCTAQCFEIERQEQELCDFKFPEKWRVLNPERVQLPSGHLLPTLEWAGILNDDPNNGHMPGWADCIRRANEVANACVSNCSWFFPEELRRYMSPNS